MNTNKKVLIICFIGLIILLLTSVYYMFLPAYAYIDNPIWLDHAKTYDGLSEIEGEKHNSTIIKALSLCGVQNPTDEMGWCSSFLNLVFKECGLKGTFDARGKSWLFYGRHVSPRKGAIGIFKTEGFYHATILMSGKPKKMNSGFMYACFGGNQGNMAIESYYYVSDLVDTRYPSVNEVLNKK